MRRGKSKIDSELGDWQEHEGGGRVFNIRLSNALVCSQFPRRPTPQPLGSKRWQADTGASASITNDRSNMFNVRDVNPNEEFVQIGDKGLMPVVAIGSVLLRFEMTGSTRLRRRLIMCLSYRGWDSTCFRDGEFQ